MGDAIGFGFTKKSTHINGEVTRKDLLIRTQIAPLISSWVES